MWERRRNRGVPEGEEEEGRKVNLMPFLNVAHSLGLACINKVVTRWSQGGHKVVNKQGWYNLATTLLHACKHRCINQYTSHAKQPCFRMVKESQVYFTCKTTVK